MRTESLTDPLTQLANRKFFDTAIAQAIADAHGRNEPLSLMMTDIDHFKTFNDNYGHLTGDQVLRLVAMSVKQNVKGQDIAARYGGEEFAIVLPNTVLRSAITVADHIRRAVMTKELMKRSTGEHLGRVTISIGVATLKKGDTVQSLIERADGCLYAAKRHGRNRVMCETDPEVQRAPPTVARSRLNSRADVANKPSLSSAGGLVFRRRELHRFAAAAGRGLVRIVEHELRRKLLGLVVHLGAEQEQHRLRIDQDLHALVLDHFVVSASALGVFHRVFHAGAAAVLDADPHAHDRRSARAMTSLMRAAAASVSRITWGRGRAVAIGSPRYPILSSCLYVRESNNRGSPHIEHESGLVGHPARIPRRIPHHGDLGFLHARHAGNGVFHHDRQFLRPTDN